MKNSSNIELEYLEPVYNNQGSFSGNAIVIYNKSTEEKYLFSYGTLVAKISNKKPVVYDTHSSTTLKHIKDFLYQSGYPIGTKKDIENSYMVTS